MVNERDYIIQFLLENENDESIESIPKINEETELFGKSPVPEKVAPEDLQLNKSSEEQAAVVNVAEKSEQNQHKKEEPAKVELPNIESRKQVSENTEEQKIEEVIKVKAVKSNFF